LAWAFLLVRSRHRYIRRPWIETTISSRTLCCTDRLVVRGGVARGVALSQPRMLALPFKLNQAGRHHIARQKHKVTNWPAYDASLRQRGSLTVWFTDEAIAAWKAEPRTSRGGQSWYSALAILTALTLRAVFHLALRQTDTVAAVPAMRALLVATARPEFRPPWPDDGRVETLALSRLGRRQSAALLRQVAGPKGLPEVLEVEILAKTDGVPLFLEELTRAVLEAGWLSDAGGRRELARPVAALEVPAGLSRSLSKAHFRARNGAPRTR
jgi:DDE family transposase